ncbi:MAG: hypothetical protein AAGF15_04160, partial [Pseudomonadota bacterium]
FLSFVGARPVRSREKVTSLDALTVLLLVIAGYVAIGFLFAIAFVLRGCRIVDPTAHGGSFGFKCLIFPGSVALWPLLLVKWFRADKPISQGPVSQGETS